MATHLATIRWQQRDGDQFLKGRYSREHIWTFDGGTQVPASPAPSVVPEPYSTPSAVDPEEAFVASIASCHMLTFLYIAGKEGYNVVSYADSAVGKMVKGDNGVPWVSQVTLHPEIHYLDDNIPDADILRRLHDDAHHQCFIANSVKTDIQVDL